MNWILNLNQYLQSMIQSNEIVGTLSTSFENGSLNSISIGNKSFDNIEALDENSIFEIGSITKILTSLAFIKLHLSSKIKLESKLGDYLQEIKNPQVSNILLIELLTHTSGLPRIPNNLIPADHLDPYKDYTKEALIDFINDVELSSKTYLYSNLGFSLCGLVLESIYKCNIEQILKSEILEPLRMSNTFINESRSKPESWCSGHLVDFTIQKHWNTGVFSSACGLKSNLKDMGIFLQALCLQNQSHPLEKEISFLLNYKYRVNEDTFSLTIGHELINNYYYHEGATFGFRCILLFLPEQKKANFTVVNTYHDIDFVIDFFLNKSLVRAQKIIKNNFINLVGSYKSNNLDNLVEVIYESNGYLFIKSKGQLPLRLIYTNGNSYNCLNGKVLLNFDVDKNTLSISQDNVEVLYQKL